MPATQEQKLHALRNRTDLAANAAMDLTRFVSKVFRALRDEDIGPTLSGQDKVALLARYDVLRQAAADAIANMPVDLQTWEPDPSEYEEE